MAHMLGLGPLRAKLFRPLVFEQVSSQFGKVSPVPWIKGGAVSSACLPSCRASGAPCPFQWINIAVSTLFLASAPAKSGWSAEETLSCIKLRRLSAHIIDC